MYESAASSYVPPRASFPSFAALRAFDAAARLGGIRRAADVLGLDPAVISRHLRDLEAWTGADLLRRDRAGVTLTSDGVAYHTRIAGALDEIASATSSLVQRQPGDRCTIWASPGFALQWLASRIGQAQASIPGICLSLRPTDEKPKFGSDEADIDIRFRSIAGNGQFEETGLGAVEIGRPLIFPVASPAYLASASPIISAADVLSHPLLHRRDDAMWRGWLEHQGVKVNGDALRGSPLWNMPMVLNAARMGQGIALANQFLVAEELRTGRLCAIGLGKDRCWGGVTLGAYVLTAPADRWHSPAVARFRRWMIDASRCDSFGHDGEASLAAA